MKKFSIVFLAAMFSLVAPISAHATNVTAHTTTDDAYKIFISTSDSVEGTQIGQGADWQTVGNWTTALTPGMTNYIHIYGQDLYGTISSILGDFKLNNADFKFANGTQSLLTNVTDWHVFTDTWGGTLVL